MKNRTVGMLVIGIAALVGFITISFNRALTSIVNSACSHGPDCPMWEAIDFQTDVSIGIIIFIVVIGLYLMFFAKEKRMSAVAPMAYHASSKVTKENYQKTMNTLNGDEKLIFEKVIEAEGAIFQSDLVDTTEFTKVKVTRILDKLEGKNLVERRRRGMSNIVVLKH